MHKPPTYLPSECKKSLANPSVKPLQSMKLYCSISTAGGIVGVYSGRGEPDIMDIIIAQPISWVWLSDLRCVEMAQGEVTRSGVYGTQTMHICSV